MTKPYSIDLRERVASRVVAGETVRAVAGLFAVGVSSAVRWAQRLRETGSVAPGKIGGHRLRILRNERAWLMERIASEPHVTLRGLLAELAERGIVVSYGALWNFVHAEGLSFKKNNSRRRAGKAGHRETPRLVEEVSGKA
jgi:transposase